MKFIVMILVLMAGTFATTQAGINSILSTYLKNDFLAAFISFTVGAIFLFFFLIATGNYPWPISHVGNIPWWAWLGGILGAFLVTVTIYAVPKLGATTMFSLFIGGQLLASIVYDHFGILGYPKHPISLIRICGITLIFIGTSLVKFF